MPENRSLWGIVLCVLLFIALGVLIWLMEKPELRRKRQRLSGREELDAQSFYDCYYKGSGFPRDLVSSVMTRVAYEVQLPAGLLRPTDRFDRELAPMKGWEFDDGLAMLSISLDRRLRRCGLSPGLSGVETIDDLIKVVGRFPSLVGPKGVI